MVNAANQSQRASQKAERRLAVRFGRERKILVRIGIKSNGSTKVIEMARLGFVSQRPGRR